MDRPKRAQKNMNAFTVFTNKFLREYRAKNGHQYPGGFSAAMQDPDLQQRWESLSTNEKDALKEEARVEKGLQRAAFAASVRAQDLGARFTMENDDTPIGEGLDSGAEGEQMAEVMDTLQANRQSRSSKDSPQREALFQTAPGGFNSYRPETDIVLGSSPAQTLSRQNQDGSQQISVGQSVTSIPPGHFGGYSDYEAIGLAAPDDDDDDDLMGPIDDTTGEESNGGTPVSVIAPTGFACAKVETKTAEHVQKGDGREGFPSQEIVSVAPGEIVARAIPVNVPVDVPLTTAPLVNQSATAVAQIPQPVNDYTVNAFPSAPPPVAQLEQPAVANPISPFDWARSGMNSWTQEFRNDYVAQLRMPRGCRGLGRGLHFLPEVAALEITIRDFLNQ